jgi:nucleotide-binding universal stress UspA family protein
MPKIQSILCPTDFSENAEKAIDFAVDLASKLGATLHLVHVYQLPVYPIPDGSFGVSQDFIAQTMDELNKGLAQLAARKKGAQIETHLVVQGIPHREIVRMADELGVDLIVMGTHGRSGLPRLLLGSVAERVVRTATAPVITVPRDV